MQQWADRVKGASCKPPSSFTGQGSSDSVAMCYAPTSNGCQPPTFDQRQHSFHGHDGHRPSVPPQAVYRRTAKPGDIFANLPGEVLEMMLGHVKEAHLEPGTLGCATCWMRDCCAVALSARKLLPYARVALYASVQLDGLDSPVMKKRTKVQFGARLHLLRRTLRADTQLAVLVRTLKVPSLPPGVRADEYQDMVASVLMACPNLERLVGFFPKYNHAFAKVFHALSTRPKLQEMSWVLEASPFQRQRRMLPPGGGMQTPAMGMAPGELQPFQSASFLDLHADWQHLTTLTVHCLPGATLTPDTLLEKTIHSLPRLQNLHLSRLPHNAFNDGSLVALPPLARLSLAHLTGVTAAGLSNFATRANSASLTSLTLLHIDMDSLPAVARILSNLASLETLSLVQAHAPVMPTDEMIWLFPYLASPTLRRLHWDTVEESVRASEADTILAKSITAGGFPALRSLRVPNDPGGLYQAVCRPRPAFSVPDRPDLQQLLRCDSAAAVHARTRSDMSPRASTSTGATGSSLAGEPLPEATDLLRARRAAQARLEAGLRLPRFAINVSDEHGSLREKHVVGAFTGTVGSEIDYHLLPDAGATDEGGGLATMATLLGDRGEDLFAPVPGRNDDGGQDGKAPRLTKKEAKKAAEEVRVRDGCTGRWNMSNGPVVDKKDRERWWHAERGTWSAVTLS
ncbi:hypothetical protein P8C59_005648 [Phyllachora maydis]|uniref:Uncharacterized protein n=1 Tax=Phyllachora maydis TaxID=1825666 RepID=A0AAD9MCG3_9PEZI|nr:hypothetical protein P8C59_005648 [Phyllachora maydis]